MLYLEKGSFIMTLKNTVYIIDDDDLVVETLRNVFFFAGFNVHTFNSAKEFVRNYKHASNACLILDLKMPEVSGLELQAQLVEKKILLPIVFLSGQGDLESAVQAMSEGAFTFLQKPIDNKKIINVVNAAIEKSMTQELAAAPFNTARETLNTLSSREKEVAFLISEGLSAASIADRLHISVRTVEAHKANVFHKLNLNTITQLTKLVVLANHPSSAP